MTRRKSSQDEAAFKRELEEETDWSPEPIGKLASRPPAE
jgi:hypothetical protein